MSVAHIETVTTPNGVEYTYSMESDLFPGKASWCHVSWKSKYSAISKARRIADEVVNGPSPLPRISPTDMNEYRRKQHEREFLRQIKSSLTHELVAFTRKIEQLSPISYEAADVARRDRFTAMLLKMRDLHEEIEHLFGEVYK